MINRRQFIKGSCATAALACLPGCEEIDTELNLRSPSTILPYIQNVNQSQATVMWESIDNQAGRVDIFKDSTRIATYETNKGEFHEQTVSGLDPDTTYFYQVYEGSEEVGPIRSFKTALPIGSTEPFFFQVVGDTGYGTRPQYEVAESMFNKPASFILHTGDVIYDGFESEYPAKFFAPYRSFVHRVPFFPVLGDHDRDPNEGKAYYKFFSLPRNNIENSEDFYYFEWGNAIFVALDSIRANQGDDAGQKQFLDAVLGATNATWKILYWHNPAFTNGEGRLGKASQMQGILDIAGNHGVDVIFSGDTHAYERIVVNDIQFVVTGGGGAELRDVHPSNGVDIGHSQYHFCALEINDNLLKLEARSYNAGILDTFSLSK